jgi:Na+/H+ antiporter NhaD/arsenite permease-like protein
MTISTVSVRSKRQGASLDIERSVTRLRGAFLLAILTLLPQPAWAATGLDGAAMRWPYALPFAGLLLSIALGPLLYPKVWHHHYGKITAAWSLLALVSLVIFAGSTATLAALVHAMLTEYLGFIVLLFSLYVVAGGILITGDIKATPAMNAGILALGTLGASIVGTTGAAMILIRPLIRANRPRRHNAHVIVFFIILVANVGGALSPLGDPPLFVGFLHGVDFFWTTRTIWLQTALVAGLLLAIFVAIDVWWFRSEPLREEAVSAEPVRIRGLVNLVLIAAIVACLLMSAMWKPGIAFDVLGTKVELEDLARNSALLAIAALSVWLTPDEHRLANGFTWEPIREVAKLFAGIFVAIIPVIAMLNAGHRGAFAWLLSAVTGPDGAPREVAYFWFTGLMSAFLDNAPTYLLFFQLAGGDPQVLMNQLSGTLASISMGAVYMGALTYIGNAPNFMVSSIASENGIKMPSFFGYFLRAGAVLIPLFVLLTLLPVSPILHWH